MTTADDLRAAADILQFEGWCQRFNMIDLPGGRFSYCTLGAIDEAIRRNPQDAILDVDRERDAEQAMKLYVGRGVAGWNDAKDRTRDEVVDTLRLCAKALDEAEQS